MAISDFADLMVDKVTHKKLTGRDSYRKPTYDTGTTYLARISFKTRWIRGPDDREVLARGMVWFQGNPVINPQDQIVLDTVGKVADGSTPPILMVERPADENGVHHTKVIFG